MNTVAPRSPAVRRAAHLLTVVAAAPDELTVSDLTRRLDAPKSTLSDIAAALVEGAALTRHRDGQLRLGPLMAHLARGFVAGTRLLEIFPRAVRDLGSLDQTLVLATLVGLDTVYLAVEPGTAPLPLTLKAGLRLPAWSTGTGRALLSTYSREDIAARHAEAPPISPSGHPFRLDELLAAVDTARATGIATNLEIGEMQLVGTAALVDGPTGPVAAVGCISPLHTLDRQADDRQADDADLIRRLAASLSAAVGQPR